MYLPLMNLEKCNQQPPRESKKMEAVIPKTKKFIEENKYVIIGN
jgi:hypothetical protein